MDESSVRWVLCAAIVLAVVCIGLTAATPAAAQQSEPQELEDFEDGEWSSDGAWQWRRNGTDVRSDYPINGTYSGYYFHDSEGYVDSRLTNQSAGALDRVLFYIRPVSTDDRFQIALWSSVGNIGPQVRFTDGQISANEQQVGTFQANMTYGVRVRDIDYVNQTFDLVVNGNVLADDRTFHESASNVDEIQFILDTGLDNDGTDSQTVYLDNIAINGSKGYTPGGGPTSEDLHLNAPPYMPNGSTKPHEVLYNDSGVWRDVTDSATVTSSNTSVVAVNGSMLEANASINDSLSSVITAEYDGLNDTQRVYVAPTEVEHIDVMTIWWKVTTILSDSTIWWLLVATAIAVAATRVTSAFAGVGAYTMTVICGWVVGDVTTGVMGATVLIGVFIALNVSENLRPAY